VSSPSALSMSSRQSSPSPPAASRSYELRGVPVEFPYEAYPCQLAFMERVIESLQTVRAPPSRPGADPPAG